MTTTIPQRDLRNHNAQIVERVIAGESFVITRDGVPVADLVPHEATARPSRPPRFPRSVDLEGFFALGPVDDGSWLADIRSDEFIDDSVHDPWERTRE